MGGILLSFRSCDGLCDNLHHAPDSVPTRLVREFSDFRLCTDQEFVHPGDWILSFCPWCTHSLCVQTEPQCWLHIGSSEHVNTETPELVSIQGISREKRLLGRKFSERKSLELEISTPDVRGSQRMTRRTMLTQNIILPGPNYIAPSTRQQLVASNVNDDMKSSHPHVII